MEPRHIALPLGRVPSLNYDKSSLLTRKRGIGGEGTNAVVARAALEQAMKRSCAFSHSNKKTAGSPALGSKILISLIRTGIRV